MIIFARFLKDNPSLALALRSAAKTAVGYAAWTVTFRILTLTVITYVSISTEKATRFEEISEIFGSNELPWIALSSLLFALILKWGNPLGQPPPPLFDRLRIKRDLLPGLLQGGLLAIGVVGAFLITGVYKYVGDVTHYEDSPILALGNVFIRFVSLVALVCCEEFLFREKIQGRFGQDEAWIGVFFTSAAYTIVKLLQFDLGWMQSITLLLISFSFSLKTKQGGDYFRNIGFLTGALVVFHPLFSLPIFGNDFTGLAMIKLHLETNPVDFQGTISRFLTGGAGGPLSSFAFQLVLILDIINQTRKGLSIHAYRSNFK